MVLLAAAPYPPAGAAAQKERTYLPLVGRSCPLFVSQLNVALGRRVSAYELTGNCGTWNACAGATTTPWAVSAVTRYTYTPLDLLATVSDAKSNVTTLSYDSAGRKVKTVDPDMGAWYYEYDVNGNLVAQTDANQRVQFFGYDALNRLTSRMADWYSVHTRWVELQPVCAADGCSAQYLVSAAHRAE